ncbi:MAG: hypothetical protein MZV65_53500 [Chromatiales bacterium]|nr:hypothetical protein [Chromatiales bacterium]
MEAVSAPMRRHAQAPIRRMPAGSPEGHTSKSVDQSLTDLRTHAVEMGGLVIDQVGGAVKALLDRDAARSPNSCCRASRWSTSTNRGSTATALTFIALQQPVASDLRVARAVARVALRAGARRRRSPRRSRASRSGGRRRPMHDPVVAVGALPAAHGGAVGGHAAQRRAGRSTRRVLALARERARARQGTRRGVRDGAAPADVVRHAGPPVPAADDRHRSSRSRASSASAITRRTSRSRCCTWWRGAAGRTGGA